MNDLFAFNVQMYYFYSVVMSFDNVYYSYVVIGNIFSVYFDNLNFYFKKCCTNYCDNYNNFIFDSLICYLNYLVICYFGIDDFYHLSSFCFYR